MSLPESDIASDALPQNLDINLQSSHIFKVTTALSSAGVMKHNIITELESIDSLPQHEREKAFAEFMSKVASRIESHSSSASSGEEEVYI
jgi:uncharacterized protein YegL